MSHAVEGWLILVAFVLCCVVVVASARALARSHVESIKRQGVEDRRVIAEQFIARMDARRYEQERDTRDGDMTDPHRPILQPGSRVCVCGQPDSDPCHRVATDERGLQDFPADDPTFYFGQHHVDEVNAWGDDDGSVIVLFRADGEWRSFRIPRDLAERLGDMVYLLTKPGA